jgi:hypothetical protein
LSQIQIITLLSARSPVKVTSILFSFWGEKFTQTNSLELYSDELNIFFFVKFGLARSNTRQTAFSALSQMAKYLLLGLKARAVIPSDPSIPGIYF